MLRRSCVLGRLVLERAPRLAGRTGARELSFGLGSEFRRRRWSAHKPLRDAGIAAAGGCAQPHHQQGAAPWSLPVTRSAAGMFSWLRQVQADSKVSSKAFELAFVISQHVNAASGQAWPTQETLANSTKVDIRS